MSWIWLDENKYPRFQKNYSNINSCSDEEKQQFDYCVAQFKKEYSFPKRIKTAVLTVSADSFFHLFTNGSFVGIGPAASGGDFLCRRPAPKHYANTYALDLDSEKLFFDARVRLLPEKLTDYSRYHGGFFLTAELTFEDGSSGTVETDGSWLCRRDTAYNGFRSFDSSLPEDIFSPAAEIPDIWNAETAPIPMLSFHEVGKNIITLKPGEKSEVSIVPDKIYGVYPVIRADGKCRVKIETCELADQVRQEENISFGKAGEYFSFLMHSCGNAFLTVENTDGKPVTVETVLLASWYPVTAQGSFRCSDDGLNKVFDVCAHTLKICRQTLHLDSTKHQELLACTGDYYIESLMTLYIYGDERLSEFDVIRTADWLTDNNGRMFHTTYSLIWVQMLRDVFYMTGNTEMLVHCKKALDVLLARFGTYIGESGVIESPPDFMFVDWTVIDGYSMHHPPKALGQTVLNAFYYEALNRAAEIYAILGEKALSDGCTKKAAKFRKDFNREFYDAAKELYFDGKNDKSGGTEHYLPANSGKRYYSKYPNILAALYGLADNGGKLLERVVNAPDMQDIQPYFMHYMLCALRKYGLFEKYGTDILMRWKPLAEECGKGLKEGWFAPEEGYSFDHSHAWGGTVAYQLPSAISGMKILEPGMKKLSFSPELYCFDFADIEIPTAYGMIKLSLRRGAAPQITVPEGIEYTVE